MVNTFLFCLLALFWGGSFVAIKFVVNSIPPNTGAFYRVLFSVIFLLLLSLKSLRIPKGFWGKELILTSITGLCALGIPFSLLFWGETIVSPSIAGILNGSVPFWTLIVAIIFFRGAEKITLKKIFGLIAGFIGIACIFGPKIQFTGANRELLGLLAICAMAIFYAFGINLNKKVLNNNTIITKRLNIIVQQIAAAIFLLIMMLVIEGKPDFQLLFQPTNFLSIIYLALFSTALAFIIFFRLIRDMGAVKASTVTFFVPIIAMLIDWVIFKRVLAANEIVGTVIILSSIFLLKKKARSISDS